MIFLSKILSNIKPYLINIDFTYVRLSYLIDLIDKSFDNLNGPLIRTKHMQQHLSHSSSFSNVVYGQSGYGYKLLLVFILRRVLAFINLFSSTTFLFNVNGIYYPAWYKRNDFCFRNFLISLCSKLSHHTIFQSQFSLNTFKDLCTLFPSSYSIIPNPDLNPNTFVADYLIHKYDANRSHLIYLVEINPKRRNEDYEVFRSLCIAFNQLVDLFPRHHFTIHVYCDFEFVDTLQGLVKSFVCSDSIYFKYLQPYSHLDLLNVYRNVDYRLHLRDQDPCPNAVIEAIAYNVIPIGSADSGIPDLAGKACILYSSSNHRQYFKPRAAVTSAVLLESLKLSVTRRIELFTLLSTTKKDRYIKDYFNLHFNILSKLR